MTKSRIRQKLLNKRVLCIENNETSATLLEAFCFSTNMYCDLAQDCYTGIEKSKNSDYDFIIIHVSMPRMDGFEIAKEIMKGKNVGLIFYTSAALLEWFQSDLVNKSNFLKKPYNVDDFFDMLENALE